MTKKKVSKASKSAAPVTAAVPTAKLTSDAQRMFLLRNGFDESQIPELARDSLREMDLIIAAQRAKRAGAPTKRQVDFLVAQGWKRDDVIKMSFGDCSKLIHKNMLARGLIKPRQRTQASA